MFNKITSHYSIQLSISFLLLIFFSLYQINLEDFWFDELLTFWVTNPNTDHYDTYLNIINEENTPPLYFFTIKYFFKVFGYNYELLRLTNIFFNILSLIVFFSILKTFSKDKKFIFLSLMLYSLNYFLISYSQEARVYIFYCLIALCYIRIYLNIIDNENSIDFLRYLLFVIFSIILINTFLFSFIILGTIIFFEFFFRRNKKNYYIINLIIFVTTIFSIYFNFEFYQSVFNFEATSINNPNLDFYLLNFFFKQYFGSKIMGLIFFLFFTFSIFILVKNNLINQKLKFLLFLIFFSYFIPILYGYIFSPVLNDKYIIYVVPIIILLISFSISLLQNLKLKVSIIIFLLIVSFSNLLIKNIKREIDKPEFTKILLDLNKQNDSRYYTVSFADHSKPFFNKVVSNLIQQIIYKKKINLQQVSQNKDYWIICYDPSNTYDYCTKKSILLNGEKNIKRRINTYQVVALLINEK